MEMTQARRGPSDRTLNRLIVGIVVVLLIGIPAIGLIYFLDRNVDPGPSMVQRTVTAAEEAVRAEPNNVSARVALAASYATDGRFADAVSQYTEVLNAVPDHHGALLGRGNAYLALKDDASATKDFQQLVDIAKGGEMANADPQLEEAYFRLGDIALRAGRADEAVTLLASALKITRSDADAMNLLGAAYVQTGRAQDAVDVLRAAVAFVPTGWCDPYQNLANAYTALSKPDGTAYANAMVAFCTGQPDTAVTALTALTTGEFSLDALLGLGMIAESRGDQTTATAMYKKVLDKDPQNFNATAGMQRMGTAASAGPHASLSPASPSDAPAAPEAPAASPSAGANP
jgi:tetratricopeptide (TPR) repeat protein